MTARTRWELQHSDTYTVNLLAESLDCSRALATVLANRGVSDPETAVDVLEPTTAAIHHPRDLPAVTDAVRRIGRAIEHDETIGVFADRDVDGVSGAASLVPLLEDLGATVDIDIPGKWDGYGLDESAVETLAADDVGLLITIDCGTTAHDAIEIAAARGIDVVVIDHHQPDDILPDVVALVNPRRADSEYPSESLAAGAVAWKVGQALVEHLEPERIGRYHRRTLPLAALATIGDYVPLTLENRAIVREGFDRMYECARPGLIETARHCGVESMRDVGWSLVPLLNAAQEAEAGTLMFEVLSTDPDVDVQEAIETLEGYREQRRSDRRQRRAHLDDCLDGQFDPDSDDVIAVETDEWVGGGPMSQTAREWARPIITYRETEDGYKGGGRVSDEVDLLEVYEDCDDLLDDWWGHPGAAGFRVASSNLESFLERVRRTVEERYDTDDLRPVLEIDAIVQPGDVTQSLLRELDRLEPFGNQHEEPVVLLEAVAIADCDWFGSDGTHCKLRPAVAAGPSIIYWDGRDYVSGQAFPGSFDIAGTLGMDDYADRPAVFVEALRPAT